MHVQEKNSLLDAEVKERAERVPGLLAGSALGLRLLPSLLRRALSAFEFGRESPLPKGEPSSILADARHLLGPAMIPEKGIGSHNAIDRVSKVIGRYRLNLANPLVAAHLQPPPLTLAVVADALASVTNESVDTFDSGPAGIAIENWVIEALSVKAGLGPHSDGVLTPGGTMSNLLALLLARDKVARSRGFDASRQGSKVLSHPIIFCSQAAHFSVNRACATLGLGEDAVLALPTDRHNRLVVQELEAALRKLSPEQTPIAIVATAGTTDFGSIDPLPELADLAAEYGIWLHVDAAYGFGALFSDSLSQKLMGIERADSITLDMHKLGWQPAAASILLVADRSSFQALDRSVVYLNPDDDSVAGYGGLLGRSLQTTRRSDAVKIAATLMAFGQQGLGQMVDHCHQLAQHAEAEIQKENRLELIAPVTLTTVIFRYLPSPGKGGVIDTNEIQGRLRRLLIRKGVALIGRTTISQYQGRDELVCLKLTLINPTASTQDVDTLLRVIIQAGRKIEGAYSPGDTKAPKGSWMAQQVQAVQSGGV